MSSLLNSHCLVCNEDITSSKSFIVTTVLDPNSLLQNTFFNILESLSSFMQIDITKVSQNACEKCYETGLQARQFQSLCNRTADALIDAARENIKAEYQRPDEDNSDNEYFSSDDEIPLDIGETVIEEGTESKLIKSEGSQLESDVVTKEEADFKQIGNENIIKEEILNEANSGNISSDTESDDYFDQETRKLLGPTPEEVRKQMVREKHNSFGKEKVKCKICLKTLSRSYITIHYRSHTGERPYKCKLCPKTFKDASTYKSHELTHTGERPFLCTLCGRGFRTKTILNYHIRDHNGEACYSCEVCGKQFRSTRRLKEHLTVHSGVKNFACEQCPKTFRIKKLLKQHMVTHAAIKPIECTFCGNRFTQRHALRTHQAKSCQGRKNAVDL